MSVGLFVRMCLQRTAFKRAVNAGREREEFNSDVRRSIRPNEQCRARWPNFVAFCQRSLEWQRSTNRPQMQLQKDADVQQQARAQLK